MPTERPHKCDNCGSEWLFNVGKCGRWNATLHTGGPHSEPHPMGIQWAYYKCRDCGFMAPWKKGWAAGSRELQNQYKKQLEECREIFNRQNKLTQQLEKFKGLIDANETLSSLPSTGSSVDTHAAITSLQEQLDEALKKIEDMKAELKRRRGGRPRKKTTTKKTDK